MSTGSQSSKTKKGSRVTGVQLQPNRFMIARDMLKRADVVSRLGLCVLAAVLMWLSTVGWERPFSYAEGDVPERSITARVAFTKLDIAETERQREEASLQADAVYRHNRSTVEQLAHQFEDRVRQIVQFNAQDEMDEPLKDSWKDFMIGLGASESAESSNTTSQQFYEYFREFKNQFKEEGDVENFVAKVNACLTPIKERGILTGLQHGIDKEGGNQTQIKIVAGDSLGVVTPVEDVRDKPLPTLRADLEKSLSQRLADHTFSWFNGKLSETLVYDQELSRAEAKRAAEEVDRKPVVDSYDKGAVLVKGDDPIDGEELALLRHEASEASKVEAFPMKLARTAAHFGMYTAIFLLCGFYSLLRRSKVLLSTRHRLRAGTGIAAISVHVSSRDGCTWLRDP